MSEQLPKNYELLLVLSGAVKESAVKPALAEVAKLFAKYNAKVTAESLWGSLKLAYPIKHQTHGTYMLWRLSMEPTSANKLTGELEVAENVIRFLLTEQPKNTQPITAPVMDDRRDGGRDGKGTDGSRGKTPGKGPGVDKSKEGADKPADGSAGEKKSLDEILEEKI